ncbi:MAG: L-serine ammonia-lyase [Pirellulales bacterium]
MAISILNLFTIGIGPSSSHSIGPMRAAGRFVARLRGADCLASCASIEVRLYGSLALTGKGHGTDQAIMLGLEGATPETVDPDDVPTRIATIRDQKQIVLASGPAVPWNEDRDLRFLKNESLPKHPNAMRFTARDRTGMPLLEYTCFSVGGGFVVDDGDSTTDGEALTPIVLPYPYETGEDLLQMAADSGLSVSEMTLANERSWRNDAETRAALIERWRVMQACVERGCRQAGTLPGGLHVQRRAPALYARLSARDRLDHIGEVQQSGDSSPNTKTAATGSMASGSPPTGSNNSAPPSQDPLAVLDWVDLFALAVSEENAAAGRVVTAPTNGAAGIIPAVLHYYWRFVPGANESGVVRFLLTAGAIGILYKLNASISGAEVGCQGEVGVACSMAAGALTEVLGGTVPQVEMAAEIGMEHNLGLTCDPIGGLVQVPCIERCAMAAVKAINASRMALRSDGQHRVSLDRVIRTMRETGRDMLTKYKETSRGGLAVAVPEC